MKRVFVFLLLVIGAPAPLLAQVAMPPQPLRATSSAPQSTTHGISVSAGGSSKVAATSARVSLQLATIDNRAALTPKSVAPLVDALVKLGVPQTSIQLPLGFTDSARTNFANLTFTVTAPTVSMMRTGIASLSGTVAGLNDIRITGAQVALHASDCASNIAVARAQALETARKKATAVAADLHVHVGDVLSVQSYDATSADGSCATQYFIGPQGAQFNRFADDSDENYVTIPVTTTVNITYAIK